MQHPPEASPRAEICIGARSTPDASLRSAEQVRSKHPLHSTGSPGVPARRQLLTCGAEGSASPRGGATVALAWALIWLQLPQDWHFNKS